MIGQICSKPPVTASPDTTVREAAHRMLSRKVGAVVVVNGRGKPIGIVTDRDIAVKVVAQGADPAVVRVGALITRTAHRHPRGRRNPRRHQAPEPPRGSTPAGRDRAGKLVGIISLDDLLMLIGSELGHIASTLASELGRSRI